MKQKATTSSACHCEETWGPRLPEPYPSFEEWRSSAGSFVHSLRNKYVLPRMREGGSAVNMSSALGLVGGAGINAYVTSKHAIIGLTKTAALEQGSRGIRVNACAPGPIAGRMTFKLADQVFAGSDKSFADSVPLRRHGTPEEVAGLVCFLLSDDSRYATGTTHSVDGGFTTA